MKPRLRLVIGGKGSSAQPPQPPPPPPGPPHDAGMVLKEIGGLIVMARQMNSLNTDPGLPGTIRARALFVDEDLLEAESKVFLLLDKLAVTGNGK